MPLFSSRAHASKKAGFTLIELIVVLAILAILSAAGFAVYQWWVSRSRDSARVEDLSTFYLAIKLRRGTQESIPKPSTPLVRLSSWSTLLATQGVAGYLVSSSLSVRGNIKDPLDDKHYTYVVNKTGRYVELAALLENDSSSRHLARAPFIPETYASARDYTDRFPYLNGDQIAVLFGADEYINTPIQEIIPTVAAPEQHLDLSVSTGTYIAIASNPEQKVAKGSTGTITAPAPQIATVFSNSYSCWPGMVAMSGSCIQIPEDSCPLSEAPKPLFETGGMSFSLSSDLLHNQFLDISAQTWSFLESVRVGTGTYTLIVKCYKGDLQFSRTALRFRSTCDDGYIEDPVTFACIRNTCRGTLPEFSSGTSTYDDTAIEWHYSETPEACSFVCALHYAYSGASRSCVADRQFASCTPLLPGFNKVYFNSTNNYSIVQTYDIQLGQWLPEPGTSFASNEFPQENTCQYRCADGYHSEDLGMSCTSNTSNNACESTLGTNMVYANGSSSYSVNQTWISGTTWSSLTGSFQAVAATGTCNFSCQSGYHTEDWGQTCISDNRSSDVSCSALREGETYGHSGSFLLDQTWTGTVNVGSWIPNVSTTAVYGGSGCATNAKNCTYCCSPGYTFNEDLQVCALRTEPVACPTFLPADHKVYGAGSGSLSLSYTSVWSGALDRFWPLPRSVDHPEYENNIGYNPTYFPQSPYQNQHCYYRCADDYHSEDEGVTCISDYRTAACVPASLGGNFSYYNNLSSYSITQHYDGTLWLPTLTGSYMATSTSGSCNYSCRQGFHSVDNGTTCESDIRNALCSGYPENSIPNTASGIVQYWVNNGWSPTNIVSYNNTSSSSECYFKCKTNYDWSGATLSCEPRKIFTACAGLPAGAHWNTASGIIQTWNGSGWSPSLTGSWNQTGSTTECRYDCDVGQAYNPGLGLCTCLISGTFFTHDFSWVPYDERLWYTSLDIGKQLSDNSFTNFISVQLPDAYSGSLIPLIGKAWSHATWWMDLSAQDEQGNGGVFLDSGSLVVEGTAWSQNAGWVGISGYQLNMDTCPYQLYTANDYCVTPEAVEYSGSTYYMDRSVSIYSNRPAVQIEGGFSFGAEDSAGQIRAIFSFRNYGGSCIPTFLSYTPSCNSSSNTFNGTLSSPSCGNCVTHLQKQDTHVLFQKYDGSVWAYGDNSYGQLWMEGVASSSFPIPLSLTGGVSFLEASYTPRSSFLNVSNATLRAGDNSEGLLFASAPPLLTSFTSYPGLGQARSMYRDIGNIYFVDTNSKLWIWGDNSLNQIGINAEVAWQPNPVDSLIQNARRAVGGSGTTIVLYNDGSVWWYGSDQYNELNGLSWSAIPQQILPLGNGNQDLVASRGTFFVLTQSGTVISWGKNEYGESGQGALWPVFALEIPGLNNITQIMAGDGFFMALRNDGVLFTMGRNDRWQLWIGTTGEPVVSAQSVNLGFIIRILWPGLVLRDDKIAFAWGPNESWQSWYGWPWDLSSPYATSIFDSIGFCEEILN